MYSPAAPAVPSAPCDPQAFLHNMRQSLYRWDLASDVLTWGANAAGLLESVPPADARALDDLLAPDSARRRRDMIRHSACVDEGAGVAYQIQCELKNGSHIEEIGRWFAGADGRPLHAQGLMRIASADYATSKLRLMRPRFHRRTSVLEHDALLAQLKHMVLPQDGMARRSALLLIEVENLGLLDRNYGETVIDEVLAAVAAKIRGQMRMGDLLGLYAKGTFALGLRGGDYDQMLYRAHHLLRLARETMFATCFGDVPVNFRIGGSATGHSIEDMVRDAESALAIARASRTKRFIPYGETLTRHYNDIVEQAKATRIDAVLRRHDIRLLLQPVAQSPAGNRLHLVAMGVAGRHGIEPAQALPLPLTNRDEWRRALDHRLLDLAVDHLIQNHDAQLCLPLSDVTLRHRGFIADLMQMLTRGPDISARLIIAVEEFALASGSAALRRVVAGLKHLGVRCALTHFGSAHATPERLMQLGPDLIIIDAAFAQSIGRDADARFVLRSLIEDIVALGFAAGVAGIDNADAARLVQQWGATYQIGAWAGTTEAAETSFAEASRAVA